jgi:uncharacterized protein YecE (DUF72 family)
VRVFVGTSGWIYAHWRPRFYPEGTPTRLWLRHAAERLDALEVNGTFYGSVRPATFARWRAEVADLVDERGFRFAVKGSRYITHMLKLRAPEAPLANFFAQGVLLLGSALGPILWQLPPQLAFDEGRLEAFLAALPRTAGEAQRLAAHHDARFAGRASTERGPGLAARAPIRHALEPRHPSWDTPRLRQLCARHGVAVVAADTARRHVAIDAPAPPVAYVRLHGSRRLYASRYRDEELAAWARRIRSWEARGVTETYVFFDNDARAHAPRDAARLRAMMAAWGRGSGRAGSTGRRRSTTRSA